MVPPIKPSPEDNRIIKISVSWKGHVWKCQNKKFGNGDTYVKFLNLKIPNDRYQSITMDLPSNTCNEFVKLSIRGIGLDQLESEKIERLIVTIGQVKKLSIVAKLFMQSSFEINIKKNTKEKTFEIITKEIKIPLPDDFEENQKYNIQIESDADLNFTANWKYVVSEDQFYLLTTMEKIFKPLMLLKISDLGMKFYLFKCNAQVKKYETFDPYSYIIKLDQNELKESIEKIKDLLKISTWFPYYDTIKIDRQILKILVNLFKPEGILEMTKKFLSKQTEGNIESVKQIIDDVANETKDFILEEIAT